jgi:hypothetical protein
MSLFTNWLTNPSKTNKYTFKDLALTNITDIFVELAFQKQPASNNNMSTHRINTMDNFISDLSRQTLSKAEQIIQSYKQKITNETTKLTNNRTKFTKPPTIDTVIAAIADRRINMIQSAQYNIEYK